jgi:hypothetical protein
MNTTAVRIIVVLVIIVLIIISAFLLIDSPKNEKPGPVEAIQTEEVSPEKLSGRWQRTDGGYIIEIRSIRNDGTMDAAYLNPNPINVSISEWSRVDNRLQIYVEMSDVNYPGSFYKLIYFQEQDQLLGIYHQAVYNQNYEVQFIRLKNE